MCMERLSRNSLCYCTHCHRASYVCSSLSVLDVLYSHLHPQIWVCWRPAKLTEVDLDVSYVKVSDGSFLFCQDPMSSFLLSSAAKAPTYLEANLPNVWQMASDQRIPYFPIIDYILVRYGIRMLIYWIRNSLEGLGFNYLLWKYHLSLENFKLLFGYFIRKK